MKCKISDWSCIFHACMSDDCQKRHMKRPDLGKGHCKKIIMKKEKPILFSTPMVQAILSGNKTQTRRIIKGLPKGAYKIWFDGAEWIIENAIGQCWSTHFYCPYEIGDILWVRETYAKTGDNHNDDWPGHGDYYYKADNPFNEIELHKEYPYMKGWPKWRPSIFMPKEACRIKLKITNIKAQKLQDISENDALAEGIGSGFQMNAGYPDYEHINKSGICTLTQDSAINSYASLWDKINGHGTWNANPWVWVIEFKKISPDI